MRRMRLSAVGCLSCLLAGCCLSEIHGIATNGSSAGGLASGAGATGSSTGGTTSSGTAANTSGGATTGTSGSSGTSGTPIVTIPPGLLVDAGVNTIYGPVAMAAVPDGGNQVARLVYAQGDGGQFGIMLETLDAMGRPLGAALQLATTGDVAYMNSSGDVQFIYPSAPPDVTVSDDGTTTTVCWEDFSVVSNPDAPKECFYQTDPQSDAGTESVLCSSVPDDGTSPVASYSNCGSSPSLVFNPSDGSTQLFFLGYALGGPPGGQYRLQFVAEWAVGQAPSVSQVVVDGGDHLAALVAIPLPGGRDGAVFALRPGGYAHQGEGLWLETTGFANGSYRKSATLEIDSDYQTWSASAVPFAAASETSAGTAAILETEGAGLLLYVWEPDTTGPAPSLLHVPSPEPPEGALAVGICPAGYVYLATTIRGHVLFTAGSFDGGVDTGSSRYLDLAGFDPTPLLVERNNSGITWPATSMALAPAPGGKLLLAISNPWQVGVYVEDCE